MTRPSRSLGFSGRLKLMRVSMGLEQSGLADLLEVSQQTISYWEKGERLPGRRSWALITHRLGYTREQLEHGRDFRAPEPGAMEGSGSSAFPSVQLVPPRSGAEVMRLSHKGLAAEALTLTQAQKALREAAKNGRPIWLVIG